MMFFFVCFVPKILRKLRALVFFSRMAVNSMEQVRVFASSCKIAQYVTSKEH